MSATPPASSADFASICSYLSIRARDLVCRARGEDWIHSCSAANARWRELSSFSSCFSRLRFCSSHEE